MIDGSDFGTPTPIGDIGAFETTIGDNSAKPFNPLDSGWVNDPEAVDAISALQPFGAFAETPAAEVDSADLPKEVFLWKIHKQVTGLDSDEENQGNYGSCVGFGTTAAVEASMVYQIYTGKQEEWKELCQEITYGGSRVEIGKKRLGRSQGSIGAWAAEFVKQYGVLPRGVYGKYDLT